MSGVYDILDNLTAYRGLGREYGQKQIHDVPDGPVVKNRREWIVERCKGKVVLDVGHASGPLHQQISAAARQTFGLDREASGPQDVAMDLDKVNGCDSLPFPPELGIEIVVCGEVLEHLANPGWFLERLGRTLPAAEVIVSVPNAFSAGGRRWLATNQENVNRDHVCWYSWFTITALLKRYGYHVLEWAWYNGKPMTAEGIVLRCVKKDACTQKEPTE